RPPSKLYEEPKKLAAHGYDTAADAADGPRRRTSYTITAERRKGLAAWRREPGAGPTLECAQFLKVRLAQSGTKAGIVTSREATRAWVLEQNEENLAAARAYLEGRSEFPQRAALNQLVGLFLTDFYVTVAEWVDWASRVVDGWPDDLAAAPFD